MSLKLANPDTLYDVPVTVTLPGGASADYTAQFRLPSSSELADLPADADIVRTHLAGFSGVEGADGKPLPDNEQSIEALAEIPYFARATAQAFVQWATGIETKNFATSLTT